MRLKKTGNILEKIIWVLTTFLFVSFLVFETYTWGRYAFFAVSVLILLLSAVEYGGRIQLRISAYQHFLLSFSIFSLCSALWALDVSDSVIMARTLFRILVCATFLYWHYIRKDDIRQLLSVVMWSGYTVAIYTIAFYGLNTILLATMGANTRLNNDYTNVNSIGMACALSCVVLFWGILYKKFRWWTAIPVIPTLLAMAATQSRKAILFAVAGIFMLIVFKYSSKKDFMKNCFKLLLMILVAGGVLAAAARLDIFTGVRERLEGLANLFIGDGKADHSVIMRARMINLGLEWWGKYPIVGVGIANPHILNARYLAVDAYLHNNFVELLCGGGAIGFGLYYSRHVYLLWGLWKYRGADREYFCICAVWLLLMLAMDFAMVSYYSKLQNYYFLILFINLKCLKRKHRGSHHESEKID